MGYPFFCTAPPLPVTKMLRLVLLLWEEKCGSVQYLRGLSAWGWEGCRVNRLEAERHPEEISEQR